MADSINPLGDRVVAVSEEAETKTASGIILPDSAKEKPKIAKVTAVGPNVNGIKNGDRILFEDYKQTDVKIGSDEFIIVKEEDVIATIG